MACFSQRPYLLLLSWKRVVFTLFPSFYGCREVFQCFTLQVYPLITPLHISVINKKKLYFSFHFSLLFLSFSCPKFRFWEMKNICDEEMKLSNFFAKTSSDSTNNQNQFQKNINLQIAKEVYDHWENGDSDVRYYYGNAFRGLII